MSVGRLPDKDELKKAAADRYTAEHWRSNRNILIGIVVILVVMWFFGYGVPEIHVAGY